VSRLVAFALFLFAAFDWGLPWLDRTGTAILGLGFGVLAIARGGSGPRRRLWQARGPAALDGLPLEPMADYLRSQQDDLEEALAP
jgi:hypothetical protein